jgi:hypothetical protein
MSFTIDGTIVPGIGFAHVRLQNIWSWLISQYSPIVRCHRGTINVQLNRPLRVNNPHHTTLPAPGDGERFSFLTINFECPIATSPREAWILIPHNSPHRPNLFQVELLAEFIQDAGQGVPCRLHISDQHTTSEVLIV